MTRSSYKYLLIFICTLSFTGVYAQKNSSTLQQTIRGIVTDVASGHPIPYATVTLPDYPGIGTTTDDEGKFTISGISIGQFPDSKERGVRG